MDEVGENMVIESKYEIGQQVWDVYRDKNQIIVQKDTLMEIVYSEKDGVLYMLSICEEVKEKDVITIDDFAGLVHRIVEIQKEIDKENKEFVEYAQFKE